MIRTKLALVCVLLCLVVSAAHAGPMLDEILNGMFMDVLTPLKGGEELFKFDRVIPLTKEGPLGQTFVTGPETVKVSRIRVFLNPDIQWQPGEGAELILWDSPEKKIAHGRYTIWYEYRGFHYSQAEFEVDAVVKPSTAYYFEIGYVGSGDGKLSVIGVLNGTDVYKDGQGYLGGKEADFDLAFQIHSKRALDRIGNLKKAFARFNLDMPQLAAVKEAVDKEDFDTAQARLVNYFETRQEPVSIINPKDAVKINPEYDTTGGDLAMQNYFQSTEMGKGYAGPDVNWRAEVSFDENGNLKAPDFDLNRWGPRGPLTSAYMNTGNEKYARKLNDLLIDWYLDNPPPTESKIGGVPWDPVWSSLNTGIRVGHGFVAYSRLHPSPWFTLDCRMAFILSLADHCDHLVAVGAEAGGNWSFTQNSSMLNFALDFPEYKNAPIWQETASTRIAGSIMEDWLPDGVETESAPGYQRFSYTPLANIYELTRERGVKTPFSDKLRGLLETQAEYFMYMAMPNLVTPFLGDWGHDNLRWALEKDSKMLDRSDMLYVSTSGKKGKKPKELSKLYPYAGIVTMRSDWGDAGRPFEDSRYLMLHGVHYGAHGHSDLNSITLYAYGRELLTDPGSHVYASPEHHLLTTAVSHNLMTIDGLDQNIWGKTAFRNWATTPVADYLSSYADVYKNAGSYTREVFFVRANGDSGAGDYWVVRDTAGGKGTHSLEQRWHFDLGDVTVDKDSLTARTGFDEKGNLALMQITPSRLQVEETTIDTWRPRGDAEKPQKLPTVIYKAETALPAAIDTLMVPFEGKKQPQAQLKVLETSPDGLSSVFKVTQGKVEDLFVLQKAKGAKTVASSKTAFDGERLFVRRIGGKLRSVLLVNGTSLTVDGKQVLKSAKPLSWVAVSLEASGAKVYTSADEPTLVVPAAKGVKPVVANTDKLINITR